LPLRDIFYKPKNLRLGDFARNKIVKLCGLAALLKIDNNDTFRTDKDHRGACKCAKEASLTLMQN